MPRGAVNANAFEAQHSREMRLTFAQMIGLLLALTLLHGCSSVPRSFEPSRPIPAGTFDHRALDRVLRDHVHEGIVAYPDIARDSRFSAYLDALNRVDPNGLPTRAERLAFWINAYNAFAIDGILAGYSPRTLLGQYRYFIANRHAVGGRTINLYDLEQKLLIPDFREPRIHFAIVCASRSCPRLISGAYDPARLEEQLDAGARAFVNDPFRNRFDRQRKVARLSKIFEWFEEDFSAEAGSLLAYVSRYVTDDDLARELADGRFRVEFIDYDWSLNGVAPDGETGAGPSS